MASLLFKKGSYQDFISKVVTDNKAIEGALYLTENEGGLYLGKSDGTVQRIQGTLQQFDTLTSFAEGVQPPYSHDVVYFIAEQNAFVRWDENEDKWVHLNTTAEVAKALEKKINDNAAAIVEANTAIATNATNIGKNLASINSLNTEVAKKEDKTVVAALATRVGTNETDIKALQDQIGSVNGDDYSELASQVAANTQSIGELRTTVATKADQSDLEALVERVDGHDTDIEGINTTLATKATTAALESVASDLSETKATVVNHGNRIGTLETNIVKKADQTSLDATNQNVSKNASDITALQNEVATKASQADFNTLSGTVGEHGAAISSHATLIQNNANAIATKASQADFNTLKGRVDGHDSNIRDINNDLATKATITALDEVAEQVRENSSTLTTKVDKVAGKGLSTNDFTDAYATKLDGIEERATRVLVDTALSTSSVNAVQNKVVTARINEIAGTVGEHTSEIAGIKQDYVTKTVYDKHVSDMNTTISGINEDIADINEALGLSGDQENTITDRIAALESDNTTNKSNIGELQSGLQATNTLLNATKETADQNKSDIAGLVTKTDTTNTNLTNLTKRVSQNETDISGLKTLTSQHTSDISEINSTITTLATKKQVTDLSAELKAEIDADIIAANAMTYKGGVSAMPTGSASIGDTYVVTTAFTNGGVTYQPGDLLIATSTDNTETNGVIASGNLKWDHVATGYSDIHDPKLVVANNTVTLTDFADNELGSFAIVSKSSNIKVATENNNQITLDLEWDSFD